MKLFFKNIKLRRKLDKITFIYTFAIFLITINLFHEWTDNQISFVKMMTNIIFILIVGQMAYRSLKNLYYTFWTFLIILGLFILTGLLKNLIFYQNMDVSILYLVILFIFFLIIYSLTSPIYYPRIRWWIYDFRYKGDLSIKVHKGHGHLNLQKNSPVNGRMTDLRRKAACLILFEQYKISDEITIMAQTASLSSIILQGRIISKREYSFGRGYIYGVKIKIKDKMMKKNYQKFVDHWIANEKIKKYQRFKDLEHPT